MTSSGGGFSDWEMSEKKEAGIEYVEIGRKPPSPPPETSIGAGAGAGAGVGARFGWMASKRCGRKTRLLGTEIDGSGSDGRDGRKPSYGQMNFRSIPFVIWAAFSKAQEFQALAVDLMPANPVEVRRESWRCSRVDGT